ncbi:MAG: c-type cytochrome [Deltaproteobacteria bacterium]|nr:c-type cytochrome [Deltaproteobacteria bacterium]
MRGLPLSVLVLGACAGDPTGGDPPPPSPPDGAEVFRTSCAACHGPDGAGTADAPQIQSPVAGYATFVVRQGRGIEMGYRTEMPAFGTDAISDDELAAAIAFLGAAPHPTTGMDLYLRYCGNCHGPTAQGGRVGEGIAREKRSEVFEKVREGHGGTNYGSRKKYMPSWTTAELSDADVTSIAAYLATLPKPPDDDDDDDDDDD